MRKLIAILIALLMVSGLLLMAPAMAEDAASAETANTAETAETAETAAAPEADATAESADATTEPESADLTAATEVAEAVVAATAETAEASAVNDTVKAQRLDATYTLALSAIGKEDYATARKYLNIAFVYCDPQNNPTIYADLLLKEACIDVIEEDYNTALLELEAALTVDPALADAYLVRTQVYTTQANFTQAVSSLEKYIELTGDESLYATVAQLYEAMGDAEAAQNAYDHVVAQDDADPETRFQAGLYRMDNGLYSEAANIFQSFTEDETYAVAALYNIGICRMNLGDYAPAIEAFTASEEKGGDFSGLLYNRGLCYLMSENWANAADNFTASIEKEPYVSDAQYNLGICKMQLGDYEAALSAFNDLVASFEAAAAEDPTLTLNNAVYYFRAACNAALGNLDAAIADYTVCIDHGYELSQTYYQRAQVYAALGDTEKQEADLQNSLQLSN